MKLTCHCGAVEIDVALARSLSEARRCDCSYCRRRGAIMASVKLPDLTILKGAENLTLYQFGTMTAKHYFCKTCGCYTHHQRRSDPSEYGVNVGGLEDVNPRDLGPVEWNDGVNHPSDT